MKIPMIVLKPFRPRGSGSRMLNVGEQYDAADKTQARLYRALGWAEDAPALPVTLMAPVAHPVAAYRAPAVEVAAVVDVPAPVAAPEPEHVDAAEPVVEDAPDAAEPAVDGEVVDADESPVIKPKRAYRRRGFSAE